MRTLFFLLLSTAVFSSPLSSLYSSLDPTSVAQHFAFYELYPETNEGREALKHAWSLLNRGETMDPLDFTLPGTDLQPILSLVNRSSGEDAPILNESLLRVIEKLSSHLNNRKLQGFGLWDSDKILQLPSDQMDLARGLLVAELGIEAKGKIQSYEASLDLMALQILARLKPNATHLEKIRAINDYIFSEMRFRFPPHSLYAKEIDAYTFLPSVLDKRRGVCLGVSILYLCLGQRIGLPLEAITPPGHIFVRFVDENKNITNIETTARGIDVPTELYLGVETSKLQSRSIRECIGLAFMNQAAVSWHKGDPQTAVSLYEKAKPFLENDYLLNLFLGFNYLFIGKEEEGRELLQKTVGKAPEHVLMGDTIAEDYLSGLVNHEGISAVFLEVDETRDSILEKQKNLLTILEKYPKFRQGTFQLAITWMQLGREKEALPILERYVTMNPIDPTANYYLAAIHFQRHNFNQAWKYLHAAEKIVEQKGHAPKVLKELKRAITRQCPEGNRL